MKTYHPTSADRILPEYTDENLRTGSTVSRDVADALLTIPAEYRQPCEAEVHVLTTVRRLMSDGFLEAEMVAGPRAVREAVIAEIQHQLRLSGR